MKDYLTHLYAFKSLPCISIEVKRNAGKLEVRLEPADISLAAKTLIFEPITEWKQDEPDDVDCLEDVIGIDFFEPWGVDLLEWEINTTGPTYNFNSPLPIVTG